MNRLADLVSCLRRKDIQSYEQGQEMQKKLVSVASEVEKLRAEVANAEKRSRAAVSAGNQGLLFH